MLGLYNDVTPKSVLDCPRTYWFSTDHSHRFSKRFGNIGDEITKALAQYRDEVHSRAFPSAGMLNFYVLLLKQLLPLVLEHSYKIKQEEWDRIKKVYFVPPRETHQKDRLQTLPPVASVVSPTKVPQPNQQRTTKPERSSPLVFSSPHPPPKKIGKIAIIGAGAMGSLFATKFSKGPSYN